MIPTYPARPMHGGKWTGAVPIPGNWVYEPKFNGWRALVHTPTRRMFNRTGEELSIAHEFKDVLEELATCGIEWLDCEALQRRHKILLGSLIVLDALIPGDYDERQTEIAMKLLLLDSFHALAPYTVPTKDKNRVMQLAYCFSPKSDDRDLLPANAWHRLREMNKVLGCDFYEGLVAKRVNAPYPMQLRSPEEETRDWIKFRWNNA